MKHRVLAVVRLAAVLSVVTACAASASDAATLAVFNTGVDNGGTVLAGGAVDPHYRLLSSADPRFPGPSAFVVRDSAFPSPEWLPNSSTSKWIAPRPDQRGADPTFGNLPGQYTYRTSFDLSGVNPQTVRVAGLWATDDAGLDILINGVSTGISSTRDLFSFSGFVIDGGFVPGVNTLDFVVDNGINPTGLRVELSVSTTANLSPTITPSATFTPTRIPTATPTPSRTPTKTSTSTRTAIPQVSLSIGNTVGARGQQAVFSVALQAGGAHVVGAQNDIGFDSGNIPIAANGSGKPDCTVNPDIGKEATSFAFQPIGCSGTACTSVRGIVFSVLNADPIPDGSVLYTCRVNISANAPFVTYPLTVTGVVASDPIGNQIPATGTNGSITVNRFAPTMTPTPAAIPVKAVIALGSAMAPPGNEQAEFGVFLHTMGTQVAAAQVDILFDPSTPVGANADGSPQCTVNPNLHKGGTSFHFQPANCVPGVNCGAVRAIVIAFDNADPMPDGATLFSCTDAIKRTAQTQQYVLTCAGAQATDSFAHRSPAACTNGLITVTTPCVGDCNGDDQVTIDELLTGVGIGAGSVPYDQCPAFDADRNQSLTIDELLQGVLDALNGCPQS